MALTVAIIGRPNVGKSTLFNRLAGRKSALVAAEPGLTRDRREGRVQLADLELIITDTAGFEQAKGRDLASRMRAQTEKAVEEADVALFVIDAREGITEQDRDLADYLRRLRKPVVLVANKTEGSGHESGVAEAYGLGLGEPVEISAEHGEGLSELYEALLPYAEKHPEEPPAEIPAEGERPDKPLSITVVGRPNVGKSTLINRLLGVERLLTGPEPGVTRDSITIDWNWGGRKLRLIDTAGLRRKARIEAKTEKLSAGDTLHAIRFAEVAVLVIDAVQGLERQDLAIARMVAEEGRALVLAVNKWDLVTKPKETLERISERVADSLPQLAGLKPLTLSATTGDGTGKLVPAAFAAFAAWNRRVPTPTLNRFLVRVQERNPPPLVAGRRLKLRYMTQVNIRPPTFALFASKPGELPESWRRYLVNLLREQFDLPGVPIRMMLRKGKNPFASAR
jgi:GTP-binding protein